MPSQTDNEEEIVKSVIAADLKVLMPAQLIADMAGSQCFGKSTHDVDIVLMLTCAFTMCYYRLYTWHFWEQYTYRAYAQTHIPTHTHTHTRV